MARKKYIEKEDLTPSRSQKKRESSALQEIGKEIINLPVSILARLPLTEDLEVAIREYKKIKENEARRRQLQYIGKLMREAQDSGLIEAFQELKDLHII